jgi:hypothetical protein
MAEAQFNNGDDQNDYPMVIRLGYTNYKADDTAEVASANCEKYKTLIKEKAPFAFVRHTLVSTRRGSSVKKILLLFRFAFAIAYIDTVGQSNQSIVCVKNLQTNRFS